MKDHYRTLGIDRAASQDDIKRAYRRLASQHHPDRGGDTAKFQEIQEAYHTLSDSQRRAQYDNPHQRMHAGMSAADFDLDSIFKMFGANFRPQGRQQSLRLQLWISLADVAQGGPRPVALNTARGAANIEINIPPGVEDGDTVRYSRLSPDGSDLMVTFRVRPEVGIQRDGRHIMMEQSVDLWDLILGCEIPVRDLLNNTFMLTVPARTQPGTQLRMKGKGLPDRQTSMSGTPTHHGDLLIKIQVRIPQHISEPILSAIREDRGQ